MALLIEGEVIDFENISYLEKYVQGNSYIKDILDFLKDWYGSYNYIEVQTSGSTGMPKTIRHTKIAMIESAKLTAFFFGFRVGDLAVLSLPAKFIAGKMMLVRSIVSGLDLVIVKPSLNPLEYDLGKPIDFIPLTPTQLELTIDVNRNRLNNVKTILLGGAPVSHKLTGKIQQL